MAQLFKNNGWFAARVGKLYHYGVPNHIGTASLDDYLSWDLAINPRGHDREIHDRIFGIGQPGQFGGTLSWFADDATDAEQTDGIVIAAPGSRGNGRAASGVVELLDLYRTLADLAGLAPGAEIEGTSLRALLDNPGATLKQLAFTQEGDGYAVRTDRWRYIEWSGGASASLLFDMQQDPHETRNLASDPAQAANLAALRQTLAAYRAGQSMP